MQQQTLKVQAEAVLPAHRDALRKCQDRPGKLAVPQSKCCGVDNQDACETAPFRAEAMPVWRYDTRVATPYQLPPRDTREDPDAST